MRLNAIEHEARGNAGELVWLDLVQTAAVYAAFREQLRRADGLQRLEYMPLEGAASAACSV